MAGMMQGAVESLLVRLTALLIGEAQLPGRVRGDVQFIKDEMESMNSVLMHLTDAQHRAHHVRTWMKQVVGLARECEGYVDLYVRRVGAPAGERSAANGLLRYLRRLLRLLRTVPARHQVATRIRELKVRARDVTLEDQAELIFDTLVGRGFVRPGETSTAGKIKSCTVHPIVHEFIATYVSFGDTCLPPDVAHRLPINSGITLQHASNFDHPFGSILTLIESMHGSYEWKILKVLDLEGCAGLKKKHLKNICKVLLLRYLSLRNTDVTGLPKQIEKLQCLETLDIRQTAIRAFSTKSVTLPMLKHLLSGHTNSPSDNSDRFAVSFEAVRLPSGIRRMKQLEILSHVEVSNNVNDLTDISQLLQLKKLGVILHGKIGGLKLLFQQIEKLYLRSLSIRVNQPIRSESAPDAEVVPALVNPPKLLESLNISGIAAGLPSWTADLNQLSKITLRETSLGPDDIDILGKLRMLRCLRLLHKSCTERTLNFKAEEFQRLRSVVVEGSDITNISFDTEAAPKLEIIVWSFTTMEALSGVDHLPRLKKLELNGDCNLEPVRAAIKKHPNNPDLEHNPHHQRQEVGTAMAASSSSS
ncbi:disease resistance protein Pik-2-like [Phragmites australis]|uniref:disease resistance protein Pik-2-like n=1 Tax=Phragmites australis TaxID=29695 RepID=UPI002D798C69|nr:disease resistance protein Pik-2-like [Phragmites australis]